MLGGEFADARGRSLHHGGLSGQIEKLAIASHIKSSLRTAKQVALAGGP
jgi:hypothetical protein